MGIATPVILPLNINGFVGQIKKEAVSEVIIIVRGFEHPKEYGKPIEPGSFVTVTANLKAIYEEETKKKKSKLCLIIFDFFNAVTQLFIVDNGKSTEATPVRYSAYNAKNYWNFELSGDTQKSIIRTNHEVDDSLLYFPVMKQLVDADAGKEIIFLNSGKDLSTEMATYVKEAKKVRPIPNEMSILTIYASVAFIGAILPGSLRELHMVSHAYHVGPILVNTTSRYPPDAGLESIEALKFFDKDGRIDDFSHKEFKQMNDLFKKAFAQNGFTLIWGCNGYRPFAVAIDGLMKEIKFKEGKRAPITFRGKDLTVAEFRISNETVDVAGTATKIEEIVTQLESLYKNGYPKALANASGRDVITALNATTSLFDLGQGVSFKFPLLKKLMHIPMGDSYPTSKRLKAKNPKLPDRLGEDFTNVLKFYKIVFNPEMANKSKHTKIAPYLIDYSPEFGRGYAVYKPDDPQTNKKNSK